MKFKFAYYFLRFLLMFRYRVSTSIDEDFKNEILESKKGRLFICNHTSLLDGPIVGMSFFRIFGTRFSFRSFMSRNVYKKIRNKLFLFLVNLTNPILIPSYRYLSDAGKSHEADEAFCEAADALKNGEVVLYFPAGRIQHPNTTQMHSEFGLRRILDLAPETEIIFIRMSGMWGSMFSEGFDGKYPPPIDKGVIKGVKIVLKNGIFFTPKREVTVSIHPCPKKFPRKGDIHEISDFLNNWWSEPYEGDIEPRLLVPHYFYRKSSLEEEVQQSLYRNEILIGEEEKILYLEKLLTKINQVLPNQQKTITSQTNLKYDLELDSLQVMEIFVAIIPQLESQEVDLYKVETAEDILALFFIHKCEHLLMEDE